MSLAKITYDNDYVSIKREPTQTEIDMIMKHGKHYKPAALPADIPQGRLGWCFDDSMIASIRTNEKYTYVEGLAKAPGEKKWILHGWVTDGIHAFDPTWQGDTKKAKVKYIGIEIPLVAVMLFVKATEYQGIIPNRHRYPHTIESIIGEPFPLA